MTRKNLILLILSVSLVIGVILTGGCVDQETVTPDQETPVQIIKDVTPQEALTLIQNNQNNPDSVIMDVRTPQEFAEGYIENAVNIDFYAETFRDKLNKLDKNKTYLVYCRSGVRSTNALNMMTELNFREAYNMLGGLIAWKEGGLPTTK